MAIDQTEFLEANPRVKLLVAVLIGAVTGAPISGLPPLRNYLETWLATREWYALEQKVNDLGYALRLDRGAGEDDIVSDIEAQYKEKMQSILGAPEPRTGLLE